MKVSDRFLSISSKDERCLMELNKHTGVHLMTKGKQSSRLERTFMARNLTRDQEFGEETDLIDHRIAVESLWHDDLTRGGVW
jgi:hypothetical protein